MKQKLLRSAVHLLCEQLHCHDQSEQLLALAKDATIYYRFENLSSPEELAERLLEDSRICLLLENSVVNLKLNGLTCR